MAELRKIIRTGNIYTDVKRIVKMIREERYELIHSHGAKANMIAMLAKDFTSLPTITTVHSDYRLDYLHSFLKRVSFGLINTMALRFIDYYIGVSKNFKEMLVKRKFNPNKIFTVYNGIDFKKDMKDYSRSDFSRKYGITIQDDDLVVGILARLNPVKGLGIFINAAKEVLKQYPSVKFLIGGDGEERKSLERKVKSLGLTDSVFFLGYIDDPYEFMSCLDINTLTSLSESFPYAILEGTRLSKATISSDVGGISDLIDNGDNGFLFEPGDYKKLSEYICMLLSDGSLRGKIGEKIYKKAESQFSLENMCSTQLDIYRKVLEENPVKEETINGHYDAVISGYYGFNNIGDDSMLMAIIKNIRNCKKDARILVLSRNPLEDKLLHGVDSINRFNLLLVLYIMRNSKLFINGGGNLIQDNTSTRSLFYYLGMIWLAKIMGMKVMIYANGIGPLNDSSNKKLTRMVLNKVDVITLREELSRKELSKLDIDKPRIEITADPALTIDAANDDIIDDIFAVEGIGTDRPLVGFSVRKWHNCLDYEAVVAKIADYMIEKYSVAPLFIPMHYPHDYYVIQSILSQMKGSGYVVKNKYDGSSVLGIMKRLEMLIGMRLHALVFAASAGIPLIGLEYEQKVEGFLQYINMSPVASAGHVKHLDFNRLKIIVDEIWNRRDEIKMQLRKEVPRLKEKSLEDAKIAVELIEKG